MSDKDLELDPHQAEAIELDIHITVEPATDLEHLEPAAITVDTVAVPITLVHDDGEEVEAMAPPVAAIEHPAQPLAALG